MAGFLTPAELEALQARRDDPAVGRLLGHIEAMSGERRILVDLIRSQREQIDALLRGERPIKFSIVEMGRDTNGGQQPAARD